MSEKDYYKILGLSKDSSEEEIKKVYRKLAMKYHPDRTKGDKVSEEKFKEISEAYAVLSDKEKRKQYDTFGSAGFQQRFSQEDIFKGFDFSNIFREFGLDEIFNRAGGKKRNPRSGSSGGWSSFGDDDLFQSHQRQQQGIKGADLIYEIELNIQDIMTGTIKTINFQRAGQSLEKISVKIPKGMITGKKIRLQGKGESSPFGGQPGDLYIQSKILNDPIYKSEGNDLYTEKNIKLSEAILGTTINIPSLTNEELTLKVPPGINHKTKLRLQGYGIPYMQGNGSGDIYVQIHINMPKNLTNKQKKLIEELAETGL
ncbi:MAG: DnaJ domain-containing protein [Desulfobacterales bacterium]|nr:DnaJ domain-containing protein [Desulfobacterales bacterium]MBF0397047.1 DnaJ domain-containing protein [Desulfobacterales bacterium]